MKLRTTLVLLLITTLFYSSLTAQQPMKGSAWCSMKKSNSRSLSDKPLNFAAAPKHSFDVLKYTMDIDLYNCYVSPYPHTFSANLVINLRVDTALNAISLNAENYSLAIDSVKQAGVSFTHTNNILTIQLNRTYNAGEVASVKVYYRHKDVSDNAFYVNSGFVFTDCEPEGARKWYPCWDSPADKALFEITAKVKSDVRMASNGRLADSTLNGNTLTYHWVSDENVATYLTIITSKVNFQLNIGWWHKISNPADSVPLRYYFNAGENPGPVMAIMPDMTTWYSQNFVEHPFAKNGFATLNSDFAWGGMENQTLTSLCPGCWTEDLAAHEFAHQWFGDMITCGTWADIWLNEGFATWSEAFWYESYAGYNAYKSDINNDAAWYLATNSGWAISDPSWATTTPPVGVLFDYSITYMKGACVLHQLRYVLGDSLFFQTLQTYCSDTNYKYKSATIPDFKAVVNQVTGQDYTWFFDEWIYWANHPVYQNTYNFQSLGNNQWQVNLQVVQSQTNAPFFKMPVDILIRYVDATDTTIRIMSDVNYQQFSWIVNKEPKVFKFDPDKQIVLKAGSTAVGITDRNLPGTHALLLQNSPNPASGVTRIEYSIDRPADVTLRLTDLFGRTVRTITDERQPAGTYDTDIDCSTLHPGSYLIVLNAGDARQVRKMVVIR